MNDQDSTTIQPSKQLRNIAIWSGLAITLAGATCSAFAWINLDHSFRFSVWDTIFLGGGWMLIAVLCVLLYVFQAKYKITLHRNEISEQGLVRETRLSISEIAEVRWLTYLGIYGVCIKGPSKSIAIHFDKLDLLDSLKVIDWVQVQLCHCQQVNWKPFRERMIFLLQPTTNSPDRAILWLSSFVVLVAAGYAIVWSITLYIHFAMIALIFGVIAVLLLRFHRYLCSPELASIVCEANTAKATALVRLSRGCDDE